MEPFDGRIVGGRIAGCATALLLAAAGARVRVLERSCVPSAPVSVPPLTGSSVPAWPARDARAPVAPIWYDRSTPRHCLRYAGVVFVVAPLYV